MTEENKNSGGMVLDVKCITINCNTFVTVELTRRGEDILQKYFIDHGLNIFRVGTNLIGTKKKFQLWDLMQIFGNHMSLWSEVPFVNNEILIEAGDKEVEG